MYNVALMRCLCTLLTPWQECRCKQAWLDRCYPGARGDQATCTTDLVSDSSIIPMQRWCLFAHALMLGRNVSRFTVGLRQSREWISLKRIWQCDICMGTVYMGWRVDSLPNFQHILVLLDERIHANQPTYFTSCGTMMRRPWDLHSRFTKWSSKLSGSVQWLFCSPSRAALHSLFHIFECTFPMMWADNDSVSAAEGSCEDWVVDDNPGCNTWLVREC
jgi:hypothetical protein